MDLFRFIPGYETFVYEAGREPIFVALVAFLICFVITRGYTRMARIRGWGSGNVGGVHLHHVVVGIILALTSGALIIGFEPVDNIFELLLCAVFGSGAALVLDEFPRLPPPGRVLVGRGPLVDRRGDHRADRRRPRAVARDSV